jgi:Zn-finger nucleic acid-binding protein
VNCPKCRNAFADDTLDGIPIQVCCSCNGIWFDRAKITEYLGQALRRTGQSPALATLREAEPAPTDLVCPVCRLRSLTAVSPQGVEIEQCTGCRGVFLDSGEIDLLSLQSISDAVDQRATAPTPLRPPSGSRSSRFRGGVAEGAAELLEFVLSLLT